VATDAALDKAQCTKLAAMAHDGLARCIVPAHTPFDGDTLFALSSGRGSTASPATLALLGVLAAEATARAVLRAVEHAVGRDGCPAARDRAGVL
jgi:L-aminopeptidase/D-esterase-like protein